MVIENFVSSQYPQGYYNQQYQEYYPAGYSYGHYGAQTTQYPAPSFAAEASASQSNKDSTGLKIIKAGVVITCIILMAVVVFVVTQQTEASTDEKISRIQSCITDSDCVPRCCFDKWACVESTSIDSIKCPPCYVSVDTMSACTCFNNMCQFS